VVYDARYWREQAALCRDIARVISDARAAGDMRAKAAEYLANAEEVEKKAARAEENCAR
jgi:hypothetical protein